MILPGLVEDKHILVFCVECGTHVEVWDLNTEYSGIGLCPDCDSTKLEFCDD